MAQAIGTLFDERGNNFDLLRLAGAGLVLFSHSFVLSGRAAEEPVALLLGGFSDGGRLAVGMFFVVSGFLVSRSALARPPADYLRARLLRLWPPLAAVLLLQALLLGPAFSLLPTGAYFADPSTWTALARGLVFNPQLGLPGVFTGNPVSGAINGSLWTLRVELACYVLLLAAARLGLLRRVSLSLVVALGLIAAMAARGDASALPGWLVDARVAAIVECCVQFAMGAWLFVHRARVPRSPALAAAGILALLLAARGTLGLPVFHIVFPYLVICAGLGPPVAQGVMGRLGDISYGTYLYAFPVQQAVVQLSGGQIGPWALAASASLPVLLLAVASRRWVEEPTLRWRRRLSMLRADAGPVVLAAAATRRG